MDDQINSVLAEEGTKKVLELLLAKLESKQKQLKEISAERIAFIMAGADIDLSWVASQESVDKVQEEVNEMKVIIKEIDNKIDKLLVKDVTEEKDPVTEPVDPEEPTEPGESTDPSDSEESTDENDNSVYSYQMFDGTVPDNSYITTQIMTDTKVKEAMKNITPPTGSSAYSSIYFVYEVYDKSNTVIYKYYDSGIAHFSANMLYKNTKGLVDYTITEDTRVTITITITKPEWKNQE